jgi:hypothetical protein
VDVYALNQKSASDNNLQGNAYVFVLKGCVSAFPCCDAATTIAQRDEAGVYVGGTEAVEEVCLAGDFAFVEVGIAEFSDVNLPSS